MRGAVTFCCPTCYFTFNHAVICAQGHDPVAIQPIGEFSWWCPTCKLRPPAGMVCGSCGAKGLRS